MVIKGPPRLTPNDECLAIMELNQQNSPLLRLPMELRVMIYSFAIETGGAYVKFTHDDYPEWERLNFCRSSRQLWAGTSRGYYIFKMLKLRHMQPMFHTMSALEMAVTQFTPAQKSFINSIVITWEVLVAPSQRLNSSCPLLQLRALHRITTFKKHGSIPYT